MMNKIGQLFAVVACGLIAACATPPVRISQEKPVDEINNRQGLALRGYDPVAYFTEKKPTPGRADISYSWKGRPTGLPLQSIATRSRQARNTTRRNSADIALSQFHWERLPMEIHFSGRSIATGCSSTTTRSPRSCGIKVARRISVWEARTGHSFQNRA
jgi:hypothetical protein